MFMSTDIFLFYTHNKLIVDKTIKINTRLGCVGHFARRDEKVVIRRVFFFFKMNLKREMKNIRKT